MDSDRRADDDTGKVIRIERVDEHVSTVLQHSDHPKTFALDRFDLESTHIVTLRESFKFAFSSSFVFVASVPPL